MNLNKLPLKDGDIIFQFQHFKKRGSTFDQENSDIIRKCGTQKLRKILFSKDTVNQKIKTITI